MQSTVRNTQNLISLFSFINIELCRIFNQRYSINWQSRLHWAMIDVGQVLKQVRGQEILLNESFDWRLVMGDLIKLQEFHDARIKSFQWACAVGVPKVQVLNLHVYFYQYCSTHNVSVHSVLYFITSKPTVVKLLKRDIRKKFCTF